MLHHLALSMALCSAPRNGSGLFVGTSQTTAAHLRYDRSHELRNALACQRAAGIPSRRIL